MPHGFLPIIRRMPSPFPAGVFIICKNEAKNLARALESVKDFAQIVVVDSGSTDATLAIAGRYTDQVSHQEWLGDAGQRGAALQKMTTDWVLNMDADEVLTDALRAELAECIAGGGRFAGCAGLEIPFEDVFLNQPPHPLAWRHAKPRFYRRDKASYGSAKVHASGAVIDGKVLRAKGGLRHYGETSIAQKVAKNNDYSSQKANEKSKRHKRPSVVRLVLAMPFAFAKDYFLRRFFLNGWRGFVASVINGFYAFMKEAKLWEGAKK